MFHLACKDRGSLLFFAVKLVVLFSQSTPHTLYRMHIYVYIGKYRHMHTSVQTHMHTLTGTRTCTHSQVHTHAHTGTHTCIYIPDCWPHEDREKDLLSLLALFSLFPVTVPGTH